MQRAVTCSHHQTTRHGKTDTRILLSEGNPLLARFWWCCGFRMGFRLTSRCATDFPGLATSRTPARIEGSITDENPEGRLLVIGDGELHLKPVHAVPLASSARQRPEVVSD